MSRRSKKGDAAESTTVAAPAAPQRQPKIPKAAPCRLYGILARNTRVGVLFRRGPSKTVQIIRWDLARDTFTPGQWFAGRIYERRCDISPDGTLLCYFAQKVISRSDDDASYSSAWTAVSKLPYVSALALWPNIDTRGGGGLFLENSSLWLNHRPDRLEAHRRHMPRGLTVTANDGGVGEDWLIEWRRLQRDGWTARSARGGAAGGAPLPVVYEKPAPKGKGVLQFVRHINGIHERRDFSVITGQDPVALTGASWADWDQRGTLVYSRDGKLFRGIPADPAEEREIADFNANKPEDIEVPAWARTW